MTLKKILSRMLQWLKTKPMPGREPLKCPPVGWGDDTLSKFINSALSRGFIQFDGKKSLYQFIADTDQLFFTACNNLKNINHAPAHENSKNMSQTTARMIVVRTLMGRAHSSYRAACQLVMQGQIAESFPVLRVCLEYSLYALHIEKTPCALNVWTERDTDARSQRRVRDEFAIGNIKELLKENNPELFEDIGILYAECLRLGGHPNPQAVDNSVKIIRTANQTVFSVEYLNTDPDIFRASMITSAAIGLASLRIFKEIFPSELASFEINLPSDEIQQMSEVSHAS